MKVPIVPCIYAGVFISHFFQLSKLNFKNYMKSYLENRMNTASDDVPLQFITAEVDDSDDGQMPLEPMQQKYYEALMPYYFMDSDSPIKEDKRSGTFQFYGARGKKSIYNDKRYNRSNTIKLYFDFRFSYLPSRGRR